MAASKRLSGHTARGLVSPAARARTVGSEGQGTTSGVSHCGCALARAVLPDRCPEAVGWDGLQDHIVALPATGEAFDGTDSATALTPQLRRMGLSAPATRADNNAYDRTHGGRRRRC